MTQTIASADLRPLVGGTSGVPRSVGLVVLGALLLALTVKVVLPAEARSPWRRVYQLLDIVVPSLLVAFVIIVLEQFQ